MSTSKTNKCEVSYNGRNAYFTVSSDAHNDNNKNKKPDDRLTVSSEALNKNKKSDNTLFLTTNPLFRQRSTSLCPMPTSDSLTLQLPSTSSVKPLKSFASGCSSPNQVVTTDNSSSKPKVQVGMDRYITVVKRGRSPNSSKISSVPKMSRDNSASSMNRQNRFSLLQDDNEKTASSSQKSFKPPPIYVREKNSNALLKKLLSTIGENTFHVIPIKRGNIDETKIQIYDENNFRKIVNDFEKNKTNFYTYQLKSAKGLQIVLKGIDSYVEPEEVKCALLDQGFKVKNVTNIINREKVAQPLFRIELEPNDIQLKKNQTHPIYSVKFLLHRKITVEEPRKRSGPVQCHNCQEYGHTKTYCNLPTVCVICGELHGTASCTKPKEQAEKKCSNCGGNHTANYRGCPVYSFVKQTMSQKPKLAPAQPLNAYSASFAQVSQPVTSRVSYADAAKASSSPSQNVSPQNNSANASSGFNFSRLEATIENLVLTINNFTTNMTSMMQEMLRMQNTLLQALVNKP